MRRQFNLQDWLKDKSQKVETRDGRSVKIISFEMTDTNDCPIAAQFRLCAGTPVVYLFDKEGHYKGEGDSDYDLFIVTPEEELTEFEKAVDAIYESCGVKELQVKKKATKLLALAREELFADDTVLKEYAEEARKQGKDEALKDLPRWEKKMYATQDVNIIYLPANELVYRGMAISIDELTKLPGFKEDESHE